VAPDCASKWAIEGLTRALAKELPDGIIAVALNPGVVDTDMLRSCFGSSASLYGGPTDWYVILVSLYCTVVYKILESGACTVQYYASVTVLLFLCLHGCPDCEAQELLVVFFFGVRRAPSALTSFCDWVLRTTEQHSLSEPSCQSHTRTEHCSNAQGKVDSSTVQDHTVPYSCRKYKRSDTVLYYSLRSILCPIPCRWHSQLDAATPLSSPAPLPDDGRSRRAQ